MIIHDFVCITGHPFQGWFLSANECYEQHFSGQICCPACGSDRVKRKGEPRPVELEAACVDGDKTQVSDSQVAAVLESLVSINKEEVAAIQSRQNSSRPVSGSQEEIAMFRRIGIDIEPALPAKNYH